MHGILIKLSSPLTSYLGKLRGVIGSAISFTKKGRGQTADGIMKEVPRENERGASRFCFLYLGRGARPKSPYRIDLTFIGMLPMKVVGLKPTFKKYLFRDAQQFETRRQEFNPTFLSVGCFHSPLPRAFCLLNF
jgi:hypothetical protein